MIAFMNVCLTTTLSFEADKNDSEELSKFNKILNWDIINGQYESLKNEYFHMNLEFPQNTFRDASSGILSIIDVIYIMVLSVMNSLT